MGRLVVVSNRVPDPRERNKPAGGLAVGLADALREDQQTLWFGWSGRQVESDADPVPSLDTHGTVTYATIPLTPTQHRGYYQRFSNGILWPLCHYRLGLMNYGRADWQQYLEVNRMFARTLAPLLKPDDIIWIHDYHLFPLAQELRALGVTAPVGFFLHIPFPPWSLFRALPPATALLEAMQSYDLIGVQTEEDAQNLWECLRVEGMTDPSRVVACPIGIDPVSFSEEAREAFDGPEVRRLRESLHDEPLIIGVDRLDYSKGLEERFLGYEKLLIRYPEHHGHVTYLQVAPVSRGEVEEYRLLRRQLDETIGRINGVFAAYDWTPIRYLTRPIARQTLAGFYRLADVALVTPLRDGMNLVAKEYVAAQNPDDPGALVLSHLAGAAPELDEALLVNPHDADAIADALHLALTMKKKERKRRWDILNSEVRNTTAGSWARDFLKALNRTGKTGTG
ncbi:alpha,alpha-trehalose-phosphate synthase (UDP-forming) [Acetobacter sp.]|jgi:trehalose 6-phosphate synthase|uniref:alpha,alpha-trehalose-phosphate synthase (UDP-forming) n=1 Tax=Acetobacter sp. TaxID=440 RepID=UPI0025BAF5A5|nr:trehalose-6-phosphate synthase [Acetobacter sp.]MCH4091424.1 trehalose-6-phosphate synthase [Acetobacter sp.]MCI1299402.1 trehalose-6-phosphate synthase [Acetobacter sp.]MCI1316594.1 trehalose-6-phosphate synthase [Acetobacter sp.]